MSEGQRRSGRRVPYQETVRLEPVDNQVSPKPPVFAEARNLGPAGIFVGARDPYEAGAEVLCELPLIGETRVLRGRVAWVTAGAAPDGKAGMGIRFVDLTPEDEARLGDMLARSERPGAQVRVWFEGMPAPIVSRASSTGGVVRLSAALPFLRIGSQVKVAFVEGGDGQKVEIGVLEGVSLAPQAGDGIPRIDVELSLPSVSPDVSIEPSGPEDGVPEPADSTSTSRPIYRTPEDPEAEVPTLVVRHRRLVWAVVALGVLSVGAFVAVAARVGRAGRSQEEPAPAIDPGATATPAATIAAGEPPEPSPERAADASAAAAEDAVEVSPSPPSTGATLEPEVTVDGNRATAFIPLKGTVSDPETYQLADPPGLAVNVSQAVPLVPAGLYSPRRAGLDQILIRRRGRGTQIRFLFTSPQHYDLRVDVSGIRLEITPKKARP